MYRTNRLTDLICKHRVQTNHSTKLLFFSDSRCLGMKSPFIEFRAEPEVLSNVSVSLNASATEKGLQQHKTGIQSLSTFIHPINQSSDTTSSSNKKTQDVILPKPTNVNLMQPNRVENVENPVVEDMNNKKEVTIIEVHDDEYLDDKSETERKYIIPLALKNPAAEPRKSPIFQDSSTNIDDLKRHILMLQNLTKNDQSFQSKFVVFPNLQPNTTEPTTTKRPLFRANPTRRLHLINTPRQTTFKGMESEDTVPSHRNDKLTIVPQVFLQNDQTPMNDESFEDKKDEKKEIRINYTKRKSFRSSMFLTTTTNRPTTKRTTRKQKNGPKRNRNLNKKKRCKDAINREINCFGDGINKDRNRTIGMKQINQTVVHTSDYTKTSVNYPHANDGDENKKLYRSVRSHQRNASKELIFPSSINTTQPTNAYKENIDLNPELCYSVGGLSYGQQKLCVVHTNIMPAISRGARSAIQVCYMNISTFFFY